MSTQASSMLFTPLQMGSGGMMPGGFDWGSMWALIVIPTVVVGAAIVLIVFFLLDRDRTKLSTGATGYTYSVPATHANLHSSDQQSRQGNIILGEVFRSLAPTLMDDEKRVMDELARSGGDVLQSDLPRMTSFSKATISKVIHNLEVRGIVVREKHKWTYWCKINPRLVERVQREEGSSRTLTPDEQKPNPVMA